MVRGDLQILGNGDVGDVVVSSAGGLSDSGEFNRCWLCVMCVDTRMNLWGVLQIKQEMENGHLAFCTSYMILLAYIGTFSVLFFWLFSSLDFQMKKRQN